MGPEHIPDAGLAEQAEILPGMNVLADRDLDRLFGDIVTESPELRQMVIKIGGRRLDLVDQGGPGIGNVGNSLGCDAPVAYAMKGMLLCNRGELPVPIKCKKSLFLLDRRHVRYGADLRTTDQSALEQVYGCRPSVIFLGRASESI